MVGGLSPCIEVFGSQQLLTAGGGEPPGKPQRSESQASSPLESHPAPSWSGRRSPTTLRKLSCLAEHRTVLPPCSRRTGPLQPSSPTCSQLSFCEGRGRAATRGRGQKEVKDKSQVGEEGRGPSAACSSTAADGCLPEGSQLQRLPWLGTGLLPLLKPATRPWGRLAPLCTPC